MYLQLKNYKMANEILYVLDAVDNCSNSHVSKLALQKLLYLSGALAPFKNIILSFLHFRYEIRGPYSKDIQNAVDHLVATGLVDIVDFKKTGRFALANYKISEAGIEAAKLLKTYSIEEEKCWWIDTVTRLAAAYTKADGFKDDDLDNIVKLVYQEPTFKVLKDKKRYHYPIDFNNGEKGLTNKLVEFLKNYPESRYLKLTKDNERKNIEILLATFFEYLYVNFLSEKENE